MTGIEIYLSDTYDGKGSRALLLSSAALYSRCDADSLELVHRSGEKPYFADSAIRFSLSHSENVWACAFSSSEVGFDVQYVSDRVSWERLAARYCSKKENESCRAGDSFYRIWSAKEAVCKLLGWGIDSRFSSIDTCAEPDSVIPGDFIIIKEIPLGIEGYVSCLACREDFLYKINKF